VRTRLTGAVFVLGLATIAPVTASAAPIVWEFTGTATGALARVGTVTNQPFIVDVFIDTNTPNQCGAGSSTGTYLVSSATLNFLGTQVPLVGGIESNSALGGCSPAPGAAVFRLWATGSALFLAPGPLTDNFIFFVPVASPGALPISLPFQPFPVGASFSPVCAGSTPCPDTLNLTSAQATVTAVPEPSAVLLVAAGLAGLRGRRRPDQNRTP